MAFLSVARYAKQQITLDEYRAIAQESVKKANARTAEVAAQRHRLHEEAEAARRAASEAASRAAEGGETLPSARAGQSRHKTHA